VQELQNAAASEPRLQSSNFHLTREYERWRSAPPHAVNARHIRQLSETRTPQGIAAVVPLLVAPDQLHGERAAYLHQIQDPGNPRTTLRPLAWIGDFRCLLSPNSMDLHNGNPEWRFCRFLVLHPAEARRYRSNSCNSLVMRK
jgi:RNA methyltransferase, TrmH family